MLQHLSLKKDEVPCNSAEWNEYETSAELNLIVDGYKLDESKVLSVQQGLLKECISWKKKKKFCFYKPRKITIREMIKKGRKILVILGHEIVRASFS